MWDVRWVNRCFQRPPRIRLGSPMLVARGGQRLRGFAWQCAPLRRGDVPDFFTRLVLPRHFWSFFRLGLSSNLLLPALLREGIIGAPLEAGMQVCVHWAFSKMVFRFGLMMAIQKEA